MFGTVVLMRPKLGHEADVVEHFKQWWEHRSADVKGAVGCSIRRNANDSGELIGTISFGTREDYAINAEDPQQDDWYRQLVDLLQEEPRWIDGEVLYWKNA